MSAGEFDGRIPFSGGSNTGYNGFSEALHPLMLNARKDRKKRPLRKAADAKAQPTEFNDSKDEFREHSNPTMNQGTRTEEGMS